MRLRDSLIKVPSLLTRSTALPGGEHRLSRLDREICGGSFGNPPKGPRAYTNNTVSSHANAVPPQRCGDGRSWRRDQRSSSPECLPLPFPLSVQRTFTAFGGIT
jgi:hypothetical protein